MGRRVRPYERTCLQQTLDDPVGCHAVANGVSMSALGPGHNTSELSKDMLTLRDSIAPGKRGGVTQQHNADRRKNKTGGRSLPHADSIPRNPRYSAFGAAGFATSSFDRRDFVRAAAFLCRRPFDAA